jgi:hypothetical protein
VEREPDGLSGGRVEVQVRAERCDPRSNEIRKVREIGAYQVLQISPLMLAPTQQVLVRRECLDVLTESPDKVFRITSDKVLRITNRGLAGNDAREAEQILDSVIGLTHQKMNPLFGLFLCGNVLKATNSTLQELKNIINGKQPLTAASCLPLIISIT